MKMHKRLLNRQNLERLRHQGFVNSLTSNFIYQKYGVQNFSQKTNRNFQARFNAFLLCIFRPFQVNKYYKYSSLQFEFGLPLFFLKTLQIIPGKHRVEIQSQNNSVTFQQFINKITNVHKNIQTIQKYQPPIIKSEKPVKFFYKPELNLVAPGAWKEYSESRQKNVPVEINASLFNNITRFTVADSIPAYSERLSVNNFFRGNTIFSEAKRFQNITLNQQSIEIHHAQPKLTDISLKIHRHSLHTYFNRMFMNESIYSMKEHLTVSAPKTSTTDDREYKRSITPNRKTSLAREILPIALGFSESFDGLQKPFLKGLPLKELQQKQVQSMKSVPQSFITGSDLPDLVHRKPVETVTVPKNEIQIATVDQYTPFRMMKPQGIVESSTENQNVDIGHLTEKVMELLEQRLKTEQERRGIFI
jgi:hypothetical protein